jgi:hypothetical protein
VIQIDVHPAGETQPIRHTHPMLSPCMSPDHTYLARSTHSHLSHSPYEVETGLTPERNLGDQGRLTQPSSWITSFSLPHDGLRGGERCFDQVITQLHQLTRLIYQHAIGTFNTCSWGPTHRSLTDTGGGYNHLRVPASLRLFNLNISL